MATPVDPSAFCTFEVTDSPEDDWIGAVTIVNQRAETLLDVSYTEADADGYRDETANIVEAAPGDVLTISVTVCSGSTNWDQALSWGHTIGAAELTTVADLHVADGCPWTHEFDFTVPAGAGACLISFWEHYGGYDIGCGEHDYAERVDFTLWLPELPPPDEWVATAHAPAVSATYPTAPSLPRVVQKIFAVILSADGLADFEVPVSTILLRLRDTAASYIRATVPDPTRWTDEILARADGTMHIWSGVIDASGARTLESEVIYANIQNIYFEVGTGNVLTIAGTRYRTNGAPAVRRLDHAVHVERDEEDYYTVTAAIDPAMVPGDTAVIDGAAFAAEMITHTIRSNDAYMTVEGGAV